MTLTLTTFAERLLTNEDAAMSQFKAVLLRDARDPNAQPEQLELSSPVDIAHFLAVATVIALQTNGKDELQQIKDAHSNKTERLAAFDAYEAANPYQSLLRTPQGEFVLQKDIPTVELAAKKIATLVADASKAFAAMRKLSVKELAVSAGLADALSSRVSHPTKLSAPSGKGGFLKTQATQLPEGFESVTEEDFLSRETATLSCSAGLQKMWILMLPLVRYAGQTTRIAQLLAENEALATEVKTVFENADVTGAGALIAALQKPALAGLQGEPQVFAGDLPGTERLSVLAPYGMFSEVARAKYAVSAAYAAERDARVAELDTQIDAISKQLDEETSSGASKAEKQSAQTRKKELLDELRQIKNERKALASKFLSVPAFSLMFGGAVPRNVAMDLDTSLHTANVHVTVPSIRKPVSDVSHKVFNAKALIYTPRIRLTKMPACLGADIVGSKFTKARHAFFLSLIVEAMTPLQAAREEWATRAKQLSGEVALSNSAQDNVEYRNDAYGLFIKGDSDLNQVDALKVLRPLIKEISSTVKGALAKAFESMPATHDAELLELVEKTVMMERA